MVVCGAVVLVLWVLWVVVCGWWCFGFVVLVTQCEVGGMSDKWGVRESVRMGVLYI